MELEVVAPLPTVDFNFDSSCSSPYITAPSSPQPFSSNLLFTTAPTSPSHDSSSLYSELNDASHVPGSSSAVAFEWEPKQSTPKRKGFDGRTIDREYQSNDDDFQFHFSGQLERASLSADELFDGGKIKPLKPPQPLFKPTPENRREPPQQQQRGGRDRKTGFSFSSSYSSSSSYNYNYIHKKSRSLSPFRTSNIMLDQDEFSTTRNPNPKSFVSSIFSAISFQKGNKKWKLKDFLLFRSASESRATSIKERLRKYSVLGKKLEAEDVVLRNGSFRSTGSSSNVSPASSKRRSPSVSAHELHYKVNRAATEEMRRKTFLPYKQGLLGCLGFNPGVHEISRGVGTLTRG